MPIDFIEATTFPNEGIYKEIGRKEDTCETTKVDGIICLCVCRSFMSSDDVSLVVLTFFWHSIPKRPREETFTLCCHVDN